MKLQEAEARIVYLELMVAKLLMAMRQKEYGLDGNWGYPKLGEQLDEMVESIKELNSIKEAQTIIVI